MRALVVRPGVADSLELTADFPEPLDQQGAVLVEGLAVGLCGTDVGIVVRVLRQADPGHPDDPRRQEEDPQQGGDGTEDVAGQSRAVEAASASAAPATITSPVTRSLTPAERMSGSVV